MNNTCQFWYTSVCIGILQVFDVGNVDIPWEQANFDRTFQKKVRQDLRPINVVQPEGVSFTVNGHHLKWHEWDLHIGFNGREGLTLHDIKFSGNDDDAGRGEPNPFTWATISLYCIEDTNAIVRQG